jgi:hypothetical protein
VLPLVIPEKQIFGFEFWFNDTIHQGMYYRGELFCKLGTYDIKERAQAYRLGIRLAQKDALVTLSCAKETCGLWGSLRSPVVKEFLNNPIALDSPSKLSTVVDNLLDGGVNG